MKHVKTNAPSHEPKQKAVTGADLRTGAGRGEHSDFSFISRNAVSGRVKALQQVVGNQAVQRLIKNGGMAHDGHFSVNRPASPSSGFSLIPGVRNGAAPIQRELSEELKKKTWSSLFKQTEKDAVMKEIIKLALKLEGEVDKPTFLKYKSEVFNIIVKELKLTGNKVDEIVPLAVKSLEKKISESASSVKEVFPSYHEYIKDKPEVKSSQLKKTISIGEVELMKYSGDVKENPDMVAVVAHGHTIAEMGVAGSGDRVFGFLVPMYKSLLRKSESGLDFKPYAKALSKAGDEAAEGFAPGKDVPSLGVYPHRGDLDKEDMEAIAGLTAYCDVVILSEFVPNTEHKKNEDQYGQTLPLHDALEEIPEIKGYSKVLMLSCRSRGQGKNTGVVKASDTKELAPSGKIYSGSVVPREPTSEQPSPEVSNYTYPV